MKYVILCIILIFQSCAPLMIIKERITSPEQIGDEIVFRLDAPSATIVTVAGEFNGWEYKPDQARVIKLKKTEKGYWETKVKIPPGIYQYKFVIDHHTWILDPYNPYKVDDGRGNINSLLIVR